MNNKKLFTIILLAHFFLLNAFFIGVAYSEEADIKEANKKQQNTIKEQKKKPLVRPNRFVPSEKINADSSVSFPVDI